MPSLLADSRQYNKPKWPNPSFLRSWGVGDESTKINTCLIEADSVVVRVSAAIASPARLDADAAVGIAEVAVAVGKARVGDHLLPPAEAVEVGSGALFGSVVLIITILEKKKRERYGGRCVLQERTCTYMSKKSKDRLRNPGL